MTYWSRTVRGAVLVSLLIGWRAGGGEDFVTREEFQRFVAEFQKLKGQNEQLQARNAQLEITVADLQAQARTTAIESRTARYLTAAPSGENRNGLEAVRAGTTKFLITGYADSGYTDRKREHSTFTAGFHPVFLWKLSDRLSFESDLDTAWLQYHIHDLVTLEAGRFLTPLGTFERRQRESWINKLPDRPLAFDEAVGLVPPTSVGVGLSGAFEAGPTKFNWNAYAANGPSLNTNSPERFGSLIFGEALDANQNKTLGGRLGFLPVPELELGASVMGGRVGRRRTPQAGVDALVAAADASFIKDFDAVKGTLDLRAEWVWSHVDDAVYRLGGLDVPFDNNERDGGYVRAAFRPTKLQQEWARNLELAFRYDRLNNPAPNALTPDEARPGRRDHNRSTVGLNYWLGPSSVLKFAYEWDSGGEPSLLLQFAVGF
jgi:cell division protein FtsB